MKRLFAIMLSAIIMLSGSINVMAADTDSPSNEIIVVRYSNTEYVSSRLSIKSKKATCTSNVIGINGTATMIKCNQTLQKKSGNSWTNVATWSKTVQGSSLIMTNTKSSLSSGTYRLKTEACVYAGVFPEIVVSYSTTVKC